MGAAAVAVFAQSMRLVVKSVPDLGCVALHALGCSLTRVVSLEVIMSA